MKPALFLCLLGASAITPCQADPPPEWAKDAIWYQIFPERFRNGDTSNDPTVESLDGTWPYQTSQGWQVSPWTSDWYQLQPWEKADGRDFYVHAQLRRYGGDLQGILEKLDYLQDLGINALYLNPVFESPSLHKYGATLYHHIDKHFGPDPEGDRALFANEDPGDPSTWQWSAADRLFLKLISEAHKRNMRIIIDGVFNHVGIPFWAFQRARREGKESRFADWFVVESWDDPATKPDEFVYHGWAGIPDLPEFRKDGGNLHPEVKAHLKAIVQRWMDPNQDGDPADGIDGWRLDVAAEVPMAFWTEFRSWVKAINPDAYLTGEIWWDDYQNHALANAKPWLGTAFDGVMNYRFGDAVFQYFVHPEPKRSGEGFRELWQQLHTEYGYEQCLALQNLYGSHDTARLASVLVNPTARLDHDANLQGNPNYQVRAPNAEERKLQRLMIAFQFLAPGAPYIFYGDEVGMWGADDPDCRKPMPWPEVTFEPERSHPLGLGRPSDDIEVDVALQQHYRTWIKRRRELEVLRRGAFEVVPIPNRRAFILKRSSEDQRVIAVFNLGKVALPLADLSVSVPAMDVLMLLEK